MTDRKAVRGGAARAARWVKANIISIIALLISGMALRTSDGALSVSRKAYEDSHQVAVAHGTPRVEFQTAGDEGNLPVGMNISNPTGEAEQIKHVAFYLDLKPVGSADRFVDAAGLKNSAYDDISDDTYFAAGEKMWLIKRDKSPRDAQERKDFAHFLDVIRNHTRVEVEVCSLISGKCVIECWGDRACE